MLIRIDFSSIIDWSSIDDARRGRDRILQGDDSAWESFLGKFEGKIDQTVRRLVWEFHEKLARSGEEAGDLKGQLLLLIWQSLPGWRGDGPLEHYVNVVCSRYRRGKAKRLSTSRDNAIDIIDPHNMENNRPLWAAEEDPEIQEIGKQILEVIRRLIHSCEEPRIHNSVEFTPLERQIAEMYYFDNLSPQEISDELRMTPNAVYRKLFEIRQKVRRILNDE